MAGMRQLVDPPATTPLPYGLLSAVTLPPTADGRWQNGVEWRGLCGAGGLTYDECLVVTGVGAAPAPPQKTGNVETDVRGATPFTVMVKIDCSPIGNDDAVQQATQALLRVESLQVERAFWTGLAAGQPVVFPHLAAAAAVVDTGPIQDVVLQTVPVTGTGGPYSAAHAIGYLERELANCGVAQGVIHVPVEALATLDSWNLVKASGAQLKTLRGNLIAVGGGYTGSTPTGAAPSAGETWLYATGPVNAYRGPVITNQLRDSLDRSNNTVEMIAERTYVLQWDCCHAGVAMSLGVPI